MKNLLLIAISIALGLFACTNNKNAQQDTSGEKVIQTEPIKTDDELLLENTHQVLTDFKNKDYQSLSKFIHPNLGLTFSPYGFIDTTRCIKFFQTEFVEKVNQQKAMNWGIYDGSGESMILSPENYFKKFVYSADFLNADTTSVNKMVSSGNASTNIEQVFKNYDFTESYFAGFDKKYNGMDWQSLILVYKKLNNEFKLIAIVHKQWTI